MKKRSLLTVLLVMLCVPMLFLAACGNKKTTKYTVTFNSNGGAAVQIIEVKPNDRISKPTDPTHPSDFIFLGWFKEADCQNEWRFETDIVKENTTLYAKWLEIYEHPNNITLANDTPFSTKLRWVQKDVTTANTTFEVKINDVVVNGEWAVESDGLHIAFTPEGTITGGSKTVAISTTKTNGDEIQDVTGTVVFKGNGTEADPYLIYPDVVDYEPVASADFIAIATGTFATANKHFKQMEDFSHDSMLTNKLRKTFAGFYNGNGKKVTLAGNCGMFYEIAQNSKVENLSFAGTLNTTETPSLGVVANFNSGTVDNIQSSLQMVSSAAAVGDMSERQLGGGGGIVGTNRDTGTIKNCTFSSPTSSESIKITNGGGGIVGTNHGLVENCSMKGCLGAFNAKEEGKSNSNYSYQGGIAGYNFGVIKQCELAGVGKVLAQRYVSNAPAAEIGRNIALGGIAGYNAEIGVITECLFTGLRVHGDQYVGGIAGINEGRVEHCISGMDYHTNTQGIAYVGGRLNVGGIVGINRGEHALVTNCAATANIYAYDGNPYAVAEKAENCVYVTNNLNARTSAEKPENFTLVPHTNALIAPTGNGNVAIATPADGNWNQGSATVDTDYLIAQTHLTTLGNKFVYNETQGVILAWKAITE